MAVQRIASLAVAIGLAAAGGIVHAQAWPAKPVRMLVGFPPGGPTDVVARLVSEKVAAQVGERFIIDNRPGASGNIAVEILAKANPDGHTLLYSSNAIALSPGLYTKLGYDPVKDLAPVTEIGAGCMGAVNTAVPHVREGRLRALGVTGAKRIQSLPDLPTLDEGGLPGFVVTTWQGLFAPAGTPTHVLETINAQFARAIHSPELKPRIEQQDMVPTATPVKAFTAHYRTELRTWTRVAKDAGLKAE